jgi:hypothetical protein
MGNAARGGCPFWSLRAQRSNLRPSPTRHCERSEAISDLALPVIASAAKQSPNQCAEFPRPHRSEPEIATSACGLLAMTGFGVARAVGDRVVAPPCFLRHCERSEAISDLALPVIASVAKQSPNQFAEFPRPHRSGPKIATSAYGLLAMTGFGVARAVGDRVVATLLAMTAYGCATPREIATSACGLLAITACG